MGGAVGFAPPVIPENFSRGVRYHAHAVIINFYNLTFLAVRLFRFVNDDTVYKLPYRFGRQFGYFRVLSYYPQKLVHAFRFFFCRNELAP